MSPSCVPPPPLASPKVARALRASHSLPIVGGALGGRDPSDLVLSHVKGGGGGGVGGIAASAATSKATTAAAATVAPQSLGRAAPEVAVPLEASNDDLGGGLDLSAVVSAAELHRLVGGLPCPTSTH